MLVFFNKTKLLAVTNKEGIFIKDVESKKSEKICETKGVYANHQSLEILKNDYILVQRSPSILSLLLKNEKIRNIQIPEGKIIQIKKINNKDCIICAKEYLYLYNWQENILKRLSLKIKFSNIVSILYL